MTTLDRFNSPYSREKARWVPATLLIALLVVQLAKGVGAR